MGPAGCCLWSSQGDTVTLEEALSAPLRLWRGKIRLLLSLFRLTEQWARSLSTSAGGTDDGSGTVKGRGPTSLTLISMDVRLHSQRVGLPAAACFASADVHWASTNLPRLAAFRTFGSIRTEADFHCAGWILTALSQIWQVPFWNPVAAACDASPRGPSAAIFTLGHYSTKWCEF